MAQDPDEVENELINEAINYLRDNMWLNPVMYVPEVLESHSVNSQEDIQALLNEVSQSAADFDIDTSDYQESIQEYGRICARLSVVLHSTHSTADQITDAMNSLDTLLENADITENESLRNVLTEFVADVLTRYENHRLDDDENDTSDTEASDTDMSLAHDMGEDTDDMKDID